MKKLVAYWFLKWRVPHTFSVCLLKLTFIVYGFWCPSASVVCVSVNCCEVHPYVFTCECVGLISCGFFACCITSKQCAFTLHCFWFAPVFCDVIFCSNRCREEPSTASSMNTLTQMVFKNANFQTCKKNIFLPPSVIKTNNTNCTQTYLKLMHYFITSFKDDICLSALSAE